MSMTTTSSTRQIRAGAPHRNRSAGLPYRAIESVLRSKGARS